MILILVLLISASRPCSAQWAATYAGVDGADAEFIQQTSDGGYIVLAESNIIAGAQDFWVFKLDSGGVVEWQKLYGGPAQEDAQPIQQTSDGGYIVAGQTKSFGDANGDLLVIKLFPSGDVDWQFTYGGAGEDEAADIKQTDDDGDGDADDGFIVAGFTDSFGLGGDVWLLKLDSAGNVEWQKTYGADMADEAFAIRQTADRGYIVAGLTNSFGLGDQDVWLLKLFPDNAVGGPGQIEWQRIYGGDDGETALAVQQTDDDGDGLADDGYVVAGIIDLGMGVFKMWVIKITADGSTITWQKIYGDGPRDFATSIQQTDDDGDGFADDGYIVAGAIGIPGDFWVLKLFPDGNVDWQKAYGGVNSERRAEAIEMTLDGGFITAGTTQSFGTGNDVLVLKLTPDGLIDSSCDFVRDTDALVVDSGASVEDTDVMGMDTDIIPQASSADVSDTDVADGFVCRAAENCTNGTDDDLDGRVDCFDPDCQGNPACPMPVPAVTPWGWIVMLVVVTFSGVWGLRRRFARPIPSLK
jgi:hypothetical protein